MTKIKIWIMERKLLSIGIGLLIGAIIIAPFTEEDHDILDNTKIEKLKERASILISK